MKGKSSKEVFESCWLLGILSRLFWLYAPETLQWESYCRFLAQKTIQGLLHFSFLLSLLGIFCWLFLLNSRWKPVFRHFICQSAAFIHNRNVRRTVLVNFKTQKPICTAVQSVNDRNHGKTGPWQHAVFVVFLLRIILTFRFVLLV